VITGASSGLGQALARHYLKLGFTVAMIARRGDLLQPLGKEFPGQSLCYPLDVRDSSSMQLAASDLMARVGIPDVVIANAGVSVGTLTEHSEDIEYIQQIMDTNVLGVAKTFQPFISPMRSAHKGTLVGIASIAGFRGLPGAGAYSASKAAAISYLESLRVELRDSGINVVTICPGYIRTPMTAPNPYRMPFILESADAARRIARAIDRQTAYAVIPWQMAFVGFVLRHMPRPLYDALLATAQRKPRASPSRPQHDTEPPSHRQSRHASEK
jgi:short-subunit dehydrogenase